MEVRYILHMVKRQRPHTSGVDSGGAGGARNPGIWGFEKGPKPDFCLLEFSYYSKHLWI